MSSPKTSTMFREYTSFLSSMNRAQGTIDRAWDGYNLFIEYKGDVPISQLTMIDFINFADWLSHRYVAKTNKYYSPVTTRGRMVTMRCFIRWVNEYKKADCVNWRTIPIPKEGQTRLNYITPEQFKVIVGQIDTNYFAGMRLMASLEVLFSTGCRLGEFLNMRIPDINFETNQITVRGKGGFYGTVYLTDRAMRWLKKYLALRKDKLKWVWVSRKYGPVIQLERATFWEQVKRHGISCGLPYRLHPHLFRHSFATNLLQKGANLRVVQILCRHQSITSTTVYTHYSNREAQAQHHRYSKI